MSEYINNSEKRMESLLALSLGIMSGENGKELIETFRDAIENMSPRDLVNLEDRQLSMGISTREIKQSIDKVINVFYESLKKYHWEKPAEGTFLYYLMLENNMFEFQLNKVKKILKSYKDRDENGKQAVRGELLPYFEVFRDFDAHYVKKENILFPVLEKKEKNFRTLKVMWSLHDDIRKKLKKIIDLLNSDESTWPEVSKEIGLYYFLVFGMIQKENLIVYPIASEILDESDGRFMHNQSFDYPFPFIEKPVQPEESETAAPKGDATRFSRSGGDFFRSVTGNLNFEQIEMMMNILPLDMTLVDENDKVVYFSNGRDRFFPRSPAIIGRDVKNCHPPESVHIVEKIVLAFKNNEKNTARFWIEMKGHFIVIEYFALRDKTGVYRGVLEVSQDVSDFRALSGEKRLLDWE